MAGLIKVENGISVLNVEAGKKIAEFKSRMKEIEEAEQKLKDAIKAEMEAKGIIKLEDEVNGLAITYVASYDKESFDSKKFRAENPELYDEYIRFSKVKPSIRIEVKG
jgi:hypothetical protein